MVRISKYDNQGRRQTSFAGVDVIPVVEQDDQIDRLRRMGCLLAQGHAFAPAMTADDVARWVSARPSVWSVLDRYTEVSTRPVTR